MCRSHIVTITGWGYGAWNMLQVQVVIASMEAERPVDHPIIDKIRACSATPNDDVDFFTHLFHPVPHLRLTAVAAKHHVYLAGCLA